MIDLEKRKRVMQRSIKLGHCICNPKQGCPCGTFKEKDICPCAGERLDNAVEHVELTKLVEKAGCASKINQNDLKKVLAGLPEISYPNVLVGTNTCDDAGVYKLDEKTALVQTVDVFMPSVDDPYTFGQIAAANSLSDVYAMGGKPLTALSVIGFPIETISHRVMTQMLRGGLDKMRDAGAAVIGGHSINDKDPKFGYAVTGIVDPSKIITNSGARPGDVLMLTKPLGVGIISFAAQCGKASDSAIAAASRWMAELNKTASEIMAEVGVSSATDVTGFGLFGHLGEMAVQSGVTAELYAGDIPVIDEVISYISRGIIPGGCERNKEHSAQYVTITDGVPEELEWLLYDPQTSGGMLISVPEAKAEELLHKLNKRGCECAAVIGRVTDVSEGRIVLISSGNKKPVEYNKAANNMDKITNDSCCCSGGNGGDCSAVEAGNNEAEDRFMGFMKAANGEGAIPVRTKELIAISLSVLSKCEPCIKIHINKARKMGISDEEINEAVWMGIAFGGAPVMMFYESVMSKA